MFSWVYRNKTPEKVNILGQKSQNNNLIRENDPVRGQETKLRKYPNSKKRCLLQQFNAKNRGKQQNWKD